MSGNNEITNNPANRTIAKVVQRGSRPAVDGTMLVKTSKGDKLVITPVELTLSSSKVVGYTKIPGGLVRTVKENHVQVLPDPASFIGGSD